MGYTGRTVWVAAARVVMKWVAVARVANPRYPGGGVVREVGGAELDPRTLCDPISAGLAVTLRPDRGAALQVGDERAGVSVQWRGDVEVLTVLDETQQL